MTCLSTIHVLNGPYPEADSYSEIKGTHMVPSGEAGNAALILANFGLKVKLDGPYLGARTKNATLDFYRKYKIDCSGMKYDPDFAGVEDLILADSHTRTIFGKFGSFLFSGKKLWSTPAAAAIKHCRAVSLDPFFPGASFRAAELCARYGKKYVTVDCGYNSYIHRNAAVNVISDEFRQNKYPGVGLKKLFKKYTGTAKGLVVFTSGNREILYGRKDGVIKTIKPFIVKVKGTLAAGDIFRAGIVYGVLMGWDDRRIVAFGAATGALACEHFPAALNPPGLNEVLKLVNCP